MTGETITDPDALRLQLEKVRATGVSTEIEEAVIGECGLAAPLVDSTGLVTGAIALVVPSGEWPVATSVLDALRSEANSISRELGADRWPPGLIS
jgi:DNA-binding IclR family transcriptional regulator